MNAVGSRGQSGAPTRGRGGRAAEVVTVSRSAAHSPGLVGVEQSARGMRFDRKMDVERFMEVGRTLAALDDAVQFWIGDFLVEAELRGGLYEQACALFNRAPHTLINIASVCRQIEPSRRRDLLTFSHHAEVAKLDPDVQVTVLERAERERLSVRETRVLAAGRNPRPVLDPPELCPECGRPLP